MTLFLIWVGGSALVGLFGRKKAVGFLGFFVFSLVFSPVIGALSLLVAGPGVSERQRNGRARKRQDTDVSIDDLAAEVRDLALLVRRQEAELRELRCQPDRVASATPRPAAAAVVHSVAG